MISLRKCVSLLLSIIIVVAFCCGCSQKADNTQGYVANTIKIHYSDSYTTSVVHILMHTGLLEELLPDNVAVEWVSIIGGTSTRDALAAGTIDIGHFSDPVTISAIENDLPIVLLTNSAVSCGLIYSNRTDISSIDDIKPNDKLATTSLGSINHLALMLFCKDKYGNPAKLNNNLIVMDRADSFASMVSSDDLAGVITSFPYNLRANETDGVFELLDLTPILKKYNIGSYVSANKTFYDNNPVLIEAIYEAYRQTIDFMNDRPDEAARILAEYYGDIDAADIEEQIKSMPLEFEISESAYNTVAELLFEVEIIQTMPKKFSELPNYERIPKKD